LMMLWANFHGGFLVGDILLVLFAGGAVIQYRRQVATVKHVVLWTVTGVAASLLSPTGWLAFVSFKYYNTDTIEKIGEYQSTLQKFEAGGYGVVILWALIALYFAGVLLSRRVYWPEFLVAIFLSWFSFMHLRNIGLFVPAMLPVIGSVIQRAGKDWLPSRHSYVLRSVALLAGAGFLLWITTGFVERRVDQGAVRQVYPEQVISFLEHSDLQGHMFNDYEYGGYLLWRLAPRIKVFIDGRGLGEDVFADYMTIKSASQTRIGGRPEFDFLLSKYQVDFVVQQVYQGDGSIQPLMTELLNRDEWVPIYQDSTVYVLCRQTDKNAATIERYRIEKNEFKLRMSLLFSYLTRQSPDEVGYKIAYAGMLIYLGNIEQAREQIEEIRLLSPDEPALARLKNDYNMLLGRLNRN
ncbi:MAG: tetratricopeptide repeat protein, partial [Desulfuromonadaceae bacterium]|nr:tetratricopeptide repeat protein [Desulfuromonadaceae bacterium]